MAEFSKLNGYYVKDSTAREEISNLQSSRIIKIPDVATLKNSTLSNNDIVQTLGYTSENDGGEGLYIIVDNDNLVADNGTIIDLNNGLKAKLIYKELYVEQFGAIGNGIIDDTTSIQTAIDYCISNKVLLKSKGNKTFLISDSLVCNGRIDIDFNGSKIITNSAIDMIIFNHTYLTNQGYLKNIIIDMNGVATRGIYGISINKKLITNIEIINISNIGVEIAGGVELIFENSHLKGTATSTNSIGLYANAGDSHYKDLIMVDCHTAVKVTGTNFFERIHAWMRTPTIMDGSKFFECKGGNLYLSQCYSDTFHYGFYVDDDVRVKLDQHKNYYNYELMTTSVIDNLGGYVYLFYYTGNSNTSANTTISNSFLQGYTNATSKSKFSNIDEEDIKCFIDSETRVFNWVYNYKYVNFRITSLNSEDFILHPTRTNRIYSINNIVELNINLKPASSITANSVISNVFTVPENFRPLTEKIVAVPYSAGGSVKLGGFVFAIIGTNGNVDITTMDNLADNYVIYINTHYITSRQS